MKSETEKLRELLDDYVRAENGGAAIGEHLRDADFMRLINAEPTAETSAAANGNGESQAHSGDSSELAPLRAHLAECATCVEKFKDVYAFFAPAELIESIAGKNEIDSAWQSFAARISAAKRKPKFWSQLFPAQRKFNYAAALGWSFAALLSVLTGIGFYTARQAKNDNSQLAAQLENQKQTFEERLKTLEQSEQQSEQIDGENDAAAQEKIQLEAEKGELQKEIAKLQTEIGRAKRRTPTLGDTTPPNPKNDSAEKVDDSLVAVNTPIFDVFPADSAVRSGEQAKNNFVIPNAAKNVVLILNAAGRADFSVNQIALIDNSGKTIWRGGGLRKDAGGNFTVTVSKSILKAGDYRLKISGAGEPAAQTVAEYAITVEIK